MSTTDLHAPAGDAPVPEPPRPGRRRRWYLVALALVVPLVVALVLVVIDASDTDEVVPATTTSTSTSTPTTQPTPTTVPPVDTSTAVWPVAGGPTFDDPVEAARSFAVDYVGFTDPVVGDFQQGDSRSGEVEVRPRADGPVTTVFVRQLSGDESWWVLGAATAAIELADPAAGDAIWSPVHLSGRSTAFEATVALEIRQDGAAAPLVESFVMGGANGEMGPFERSVVFAPPTADAGAIVLFTESMKDGSVMEASVVRVRFAPPPPATSTVVLSGAGVAGVAFGTPADEAVARLTDVLGPPAEDRTVTAFMPEGIGGENTTLRNVRYGALLVSFTDWPIIRSDGVVHLARWIAFEPRGPGGQALATPDGIVVGSTMADLQAAYGERLTAGYEDCVGGYRFSVAGDDQFPVAGGLDRAPEDPAAVVTLMTAGLQSSC